MSRITRRNFVKLTLASGVLTAAVPAPALVAGTNLNEKIAMGGIGIGWRGGDHLNAFNGMSDVSLCAFADPDDARLATAKSRIKDAACYRDMRRIFDDKSIDAVYVATCNHWHCLASIWAMQAGKHVYVEKPLSHSQWEGDQVVKAARKYGMICQVGTQQRSDPMQDEIKKFLHEEKALGEIKSCAVNRYGRRLPIGKRSTPLPIPEGIDYDLWLGPAQDEPLFREKFHYDWHWDWNTGSGEMGNWGVHVLDDAINNVLLDKVPYPKRIMGGGARVTYQDAGETPNVHFVWFDTGSIPMVIGLSNITAGPNTKSAGKHTGPGSGYCVYCEGGMFWGERGRGKALTYDGKVIREFKGNSGSGHQRNFIEAVRAHDRSIQNGEVKLANEVVAWCNFSNIAFRVGKPYQQKNADILNGKTDGRWEELLANTRELLDANGLTMENSEVVLSDVLTYDEKVGKFTGDSAEAANALLKREYREGFVVPEI
ncbi:MAG: Gfo/Idh/MocA family oxidoreductase [Planctomycetaceae bacterium]|nr:Gfo/Idh/MocA family oxidoreductase [Planctomycetaceae bacterium]